MVAERRSFRRFGVVLCLAALVVAEVPGSARARTAPRLPAQLTPVERARVSTVTDAATLATRYDVPPFPARRDVFEYLLDHPEFATHVTRTLRFGRYRIWHTTEGLWLDDGWGTRGRFEVVHAGKGVRVMYARGEYEQRILPNIAGQAVVVIEYADRRGAGGRAEIATAISGFVKLDSGWLDMASRVATPIAAAKAEDEARHLGKLFARTTRAIDEDPSRVLELLRQRPDVPRRELEEFRQLLLSLPRTSSP